MTELARDLEHLRTPGSVKAAIARRAAGLSPPARGLLEVASIVGRHFTTAVLAAAIGRPTSTVEGQLREAVATGLIEPATDGGESVPLDLAGQLRRVGGMFWFSAKTLHGS